MVNRSFKLLLRRAGLPNIRFHDLWHTCATLMLEMGLNPKVAQKCLGHSNVFVTMGIYSHVISEMCLEAAKVIGDLHGYRSLGQTITVSTLILSPTIVLTITATITPRESRRV